MGSKFCAKDWDPKHGVWTKRIPPWVRGGDNAQICRTCNPTSTATMTSRTHEDPETSDTVIVVSQISTSNEEAASVSARSQDQAISSNGALGTNEAASDTIRE